MLTIRFDGHDYTVDVENTSFKEVIDIFDTDGFVVESVCIDHNMEQATSLENDYDYYELMKLTPDQRVEQVVGVWATGEY